MSRARDRTFRFGKREVLGLDELISEFDVDTSARDHLEECFNVFEEEFGILVGQLRREDPMEWLCGPPKTKNPVRWLEFKAASEDAWSELLYRLALERRSRGLPQLRKEPQTVGEFVHAWCGKSA